MSTKAETKDLEILERNKADISAVNEVLEKVKRLEMMACEGEDTSNQGSHFSRRDEDHDSEEMKDIVNKHIQKSVHDYDHIGELRPGTDNKHIAKINKN